MSDLISRSALHGTFRAYMIERFDRERCSSEESCKNCDRPCLWIRKVGEAPTVDAVPVVHGRWIPFKSEAAGNIQYCSACGIGNPNKTKYCPNCGAKMDGENNG